MMHRHGGTDAQGVARWDFSTNANACGPCPIALDAVRAADASRYPDPEYTQLRECLADFHGVATQRIVLAASASECIMRLTAAARHVGGQRVWLPAPAYGDYGRAAAAWGLQTVSEAADADLLWLCEPASPLGGPEAMVAEVAEVARQGGTLVLDRAYEPLRLSGACSLGIAMLDNVWQLWSPNKALGMTGVRGAYAIAPDPLAMLIQTVRAMEPSWCLGAHAVAMLSAWVRDDVQHWLACSREQLSSWKAIQRQQLTRMGWTCLPSDANYFCARPPQALDTGVLRLRGIKLRETATLGLAGHWRLSVQPPAAQTALQQALLTQRERAG